MPVLDFQVDSFPGGLSEVHLVSVNFTGGLIGLQTKAVAMDTTDVRSVPSSRLSHLIVSVLPLTYFTKYLRPC